MDVVEAVKFIKDGEEGKVKTMLEKYPKINPKNMKTLVTAAIETGNVNIVVLLHENGANENASLDIAVNSDNEVIIKLLIDRGANANEGLYFAIKANKTNAIRVLLEKGADINTDKRQGSTPLHTAITQKCDASIIQFLLENGASCNARTKNNKTALELLQALKKGKNDLKTDENFLKIEDLLKSNTPSDNEFECLQGLPDGLSGYSYQIKLFTLYAVVNTKRTIASGSKYELGTEVTAILPFDDIYLRETQNGKTSYCRFVQVKQTKKPYLNKIHQSSFFTMLKKEKNMKEFVKGHDTLVKMFVKFNEIIDNLSLSDGVVGDFIYCTNTNFADTSSPCLNCEETVSDDRFYGISKQKWSIVDWRYMLNEIKYVLLNFMESSSALCIADGEFKHELVAQIKILDDFRSLDINSKPEVEGLWPTSKIIRECLDVFEKYLDYLENCKSRIKNFADNLESLKNDFPEECELPPYTGDSNIFKNSCIDKINEACKRIKNDKELFSHFKQWDDDIIHDKINKFINHFCIYTGCSSSDELDDIITKEISEEFQYHNSEFLSVYCVQYLTKWVSSFKNKRGKFFTDENGKGLFDALRALIFKGLSEAFVEEIGVQNIRFKNSNNKLLDFLNTNNTKHVLHIVTENTRLNTIKTLQTLKENKISNYGENFLCVNSEIIFKSDIMLKNIIGAFLSEFSYNLLIIECCTVTSKTWHNLNQFTESLKTVFKKHVNKKIIIIGNNNNKFADNLKLVLKKHETFTECVAFKDLIKETQEIILNQIVDFQNSQSLSGKELRINDLFDLHTANAIIDEECISIITKNNEIVKLGNAKAFHSDEYNTEYYIPRLIQHQVINIKVLENFYEVTYLITGMSKELLLSKIDVDEELIYIWEENVKYANGIILCTDSDNCEVIFNSITDNCEGIVMWFEFRGDLLFWKGFKTDTPYDIGMFQIPEVDKDILNKYSTPPEMLNQKIIILANHPGEGKSTMLTDLAITLKVSCPTLWIVRIDLKDYVGHKSVTSLININFSDEETSEAIDTIIRMVIHGPNKDNDLKLEKILLKAALNGHGSTKVVLLFDGFDEISPDYKEKACVLLKALKKSKVKQIWVTTRVQIKTYLENELQTPACMLTPFTEEQQILFLNKFWKWQLKNYEISEDEMNEEITIENTISNLKLCLKNYKQSTETVDGFESLEKVIDKHPYSTLEALHKAINEELNLCLCAEMSLERWKLSIRDDHNFTKVPLNLKMLAENIFKSKWQISKFENFSLFELYKQFIDYKLVNIYQQSKSTTQRGNQADTDLVDVAATIFRKMHRELAVKTLFMPSNELPELNICSEFRNVYEKLTRIGLVRTRGNYVEFVHRSYAEYFFSEYLFIHFNQPIVQSEFMVNVLINDNYHLVRTFFDEFYKQGDNNAYNGHPTMLTQTKTRFLVQDVLERLVTDHNSRGESALHVASLHGHTHICAIILNHSGSHGNSKILDNLITQSDNEQHTALHLAAQNGKIEVCKIMLGSIKGYSSAFKELITMSDAEGRTALHIAAWIGNTAICELIIKATEFESDIFKRLVLACDEDGWTALHIAGRDGHKDVCQTIMDSVRKHGEDIFEELVMKTDLEGQTALHVAAKHNNVDVCDLIIVNAIKCPIIFKKLMMNCDEEGQTILHIAAWEGHTTVCELIIEKCNRNYDQEHFVLFEYLITKQDELQQTILYAAVFQNHQEVVDIIMQTVKEYPEIMKSLIMKCDDEGDTALEVALWFKNKTIFDLILKTVKEDPNIFENIILKTDVNGQTILHKAAQKGNNVACELILDTIKTYPDVLKKLTIICDEEGQTALHISARQGNEKVCAAIANNVKEHEQAFKDLIISCNKKEQSALHVAILYENKDVFDTILLCVNTLANVLESLLMLCDSENNTILHYAAFNNTDDFIFLIWFRAEKHLEIFYDLVLRRNVKEQTVLHILALNNYKESCVILFETIKNEKETFKSLIMIPDNEGNTASKVALTNANKDVFNLISHYVSEYFNSFTDHKILFSNGDTSIFGLAFSDKNIFKEIIQEKSEEDADAFKEWIIKRNNRGQTILHSAVFNDDVELYEMILESIKNDAELVENLILKVDNEERTILHVAVFEGNRLMLTIIVQSMKKYCGIFNELITKSDEFGETVLHLAAWKGDGQIFKILTETSIEYSVFDCLITECDDAGETALHIAARKGNKAICELILEKVKSKPQIFEDIIMKCDKENQTVLHKAAKQTDKEVAAMMIDAVKENSGNLKNLLMKTDEELQTALHTAAWKGNGDICNIILQSVKDQPAFFKDILLKCDENGQTAMHLSTLHGNEEACKFIMEHVRDHPSILEAMLNKCDKKGWSAIHFVAWHGNRESCEIILKIVNEYPNILKTLVYKCDNEGQTVVHINKRWHDTDPVWDMILQVCGDHVDIFNTLIMMCNNKGQTPLHVAAMHNNIEACSIMLRKANEHDVFKKFVTKIDIDGQTALHVAAWNESVEACEVILENVKGNHEIFHDLIMTYDNQKCTALHYAAMNQCMEILNITFEKAKAYPDIMELLRIKFIRSEWTRPGLLGSNTLRTMTEPHRIHH